MSSPFAPTADPLDPRQQSYHSAAKAEQGIRSGSLSNAQLAQLASNYKLTPATLMAECTDWWTPALWLQYLGAEIASLIARGGGGLLVSAPPRHGKSKLVTVATPLWTLENFPNKNVIVATYGEDLSTDFTREVKDIIKANQHKLSIKIRRDVDRAANFLTQEGGGLKAVGLRGTITGRGADVLIIDDYIKEPKEALNHAYLESLKTWFATVARTRLEPGAVVIIVATRWVPNDLHGHIERLEARRHRKFYKIIKLKAISGKQDLDADPTGQTWVEDPSYPDLIGRPPGTPLFPERYNREALLDIIDELGARWFEAMFQQNPMADGVNVTNPDNLNIFSRAEFEALVASSTRRDTRFKFLRSWDFAGTKDAGDFTCGMDVCYDKMTENLYLLGAEHGQFSAAKVQELFEKRAKEEKEGGDPDQYEVVIEQESGSAGIFAAQKFIDLAPTRRVRVVKATAEGSKLLKAQPFLAAVEKKKVYIVVPNVDDYSKQPWAQKFIDEYTAFPEGAHDDMMDAASNAYNDATGKKFKGGSFGRGEGAKAAQETLKGKREGSQDQQSGSAADLGVRLKARGSVTFGRSVSSVAKLGKVRKPSFRTR